MSLSKVESLPIEMKIGDRIYEILAPLKESEKRILHRKMLERVLEMKANSGEDDGQYLLNHQENIPVVLQGKVAFIFPEWHNHDHPEYVCYIYWKDGCWITGWQLFAYDYWEDNGRVLRRKK